MSVTVTATPLEWETWRDRVVVFGHRIRGSYAIPLARLQTPAPLLEAA